MHDYDSDCICSDCSSHDERAKENDARAKKEAFEEQEHRRRWQEEAERRQPVLQIVEVTV